MNTLGDVKAKIRALLGDPDGDWITDGYMMPLIDVTYKLQTTYLKNATGQNLEHIALVLKVPVGTTSLYPYQEKGKPLEGLYTPDEVWIKPAGAPENWFRKAQGPQGLPHIAPPGAPLMKGSAPMSWNWMGNQLLVTPVNGALDMEVHGRFNPPQLQDETDILVVSPDMEPVTATGAAAVIGVERTNPQILAGYASMAEAGLDNIAAELVRQKQANPARTGRMDRNLAGFYGWRWR